MIRDVVAVVGTVLAFVQVVPYVKSILRGETRPARSTYMIWAVVNLVGTTAYVSAGAGITAWVRIGFTASSLVVLVLALRHGVGVGGSSPLDLACLGLAGVALAAWWWTDDPDTAVYATLVASSIAFIPTITKARSHPETEDTLSWTLATCAAFLSLWTLTTVAAVVALPVTASFVGDAAVLGFLARGHYRRRHAHQEARAAAAAVGLSTMEVDTLPVTIAHVILARLDHAPSSRHGITDDDVTYAADVVRGDPEGSLILALGAPIPDDRPDLRDARKDGRYLHPRHHHTTETTHA